VLARPVTTNSKFDSPPDEVPLTIACDDESERGRGQRRDACGGCPKLFWQTKTRRAPATAREHTNYHMTHVTSTASCHVLIKSGYSIQKFIPQPPVQCGALGHFSPLYS
jgi:hypothetical protein